MITGYPSMARKMPMKSFLCMGRILAKARRRSSCVSARIISRTAAMRSASKNMCSVRQRPMPVAPKRRATVASRGVSALVRTPRSAISSAQDISLANC